MKLIIPAQNGLVIFLGQDPVTVPPRGCATRRFVAPTKDC